MSQFAQREAFTCPFKLNSPWVVLSPLEQSIKKKIEKAGTPLKDWDIQIYRGVLTGCNEAFIIDDAKRKEILANCRTAAERKRTDALIRPILRGRDIKRYSHQWAGLYIIATFPALHLDIDDYPAIKNHLLSFGKERLEQSGKNIIIDGKKAKSRKKTNNKWFETQDTIAYMDDFRKPKIIYPETTQGAYFSYDENGFYIDKTCFMLITKFPKWLQSTLSSKLFEYAYRRIFSSIELGGHAYQYNKHALIKLPVILPEVDKTLTDEEVFRLYGIDKTTQLAIEAKQNAGEYPV